MATAAEVLADLTAHPDATVAIVTGEMGFGAGETTLLAHGDGRLELVNRTERDERRLEGPRDPERVARLGRELAQLGLTELRATEGLRVPGDSPVVVRVELGGQVLHEADLWYADRHSDPGLDGVIRLYDGIVHEISGGKLPYP
jgi:hypothetical protein